MAPSGGDRGTKASSFFADYGPSPVRRPSTTFSHEEPDQAGVGARYGGVDLGGAMATADGAEGAPMLRPPTPGSDPFARVYRVSFAAYTLPPRLAMDDSSRISVYTNGISRASRAYHHGTVYDDDEDVPLVTIHLDKMQLGPAMTS